MWILLVFACDVTRSSGLGTRTLPPQGAADADVDADADADADSDADSDTDVLNTGDTLQTGDTLGTGDTAVPYDGPTIIDDWSLTCPDLNNWQLRVETTGRTDGLASVYMMETANAYPWDEQHDVDSVDFDPLGLWEDHEVLMEDEKRPISDWVPGQSTVFTCGVHDTPNTMTWVIRVYDDTGALADCVVMGEDPTGMINGKYDADMINGPADPREFANCTEVSY